MFIKGVVAFAAALFLWEITLNFLSNINTSYEKRNDRRTLRKDIIIRKN